MSRDRSTLLVTLGAVAVLAPAGVFAYYRSVLDRESRSIAALRERRDSVRTALPNASTAADSTRLLQDLRAREEGIGSWAYHQAHSQQLVDRYWEIPGLPMLTVAAGLVCLVGGVMLRAHGRRSAPS